ncbi:MAG: RnfH family protein [Methylococcaceae bacterium]|nr:RnfH family protein [Methylococcaceae bacterium]
MRVEVAYAEPAEQALISLDLPEGSCAEDAIVRSGILERFPGIDLAHNKIGIFGKLCGLDRILVERDRVEIYRPLLAAPKEARRSRAAKG